MFGSTKLRFVVPLYAMIKENTNSVIERYIVFGFSGCIPQNRLNNFDLDDRSTTQVKVERQNVIFGCPCEKGECANDGTCTATNLTTPLVNYTTPWMECKCVGQWTGPLCQEYEEDEQGFAPRK